MGDWTSTLTTAAERTVLILTEHYVRATPEPTNVEAGRIVEFPPFRCGRYLCYDLISPAGGGIKFRVLLRGEVKITVNGETVLDFRQFHAVGQEPLEGWHYGWHEVTVAPERMIENWARIGIENPAVESARLDFEKIEVEAQAKPALGRMPSSPAQTTGEGFQLIVGDQKRPLSWEAESSERLSISLTCRRREHGAFQVGVIPLGRSLRHIRLELPDLSGPNGAVIPADALNWFAIGSLGSHLPQPPALAAYTEKSGKPGPDRWVPDILVTAESLDIDDGCGQGMWVDIEVPAEVPAGVYHGEVRVLADGCEPQVVGMELAVDEFLSRSVSHEAREIGSTTQVFLDDYIVENIDSARIHYHAFKKHPLNPLIVPDSPGELSTAFLYGTVLRDTSDGSFRMWYLSTAFTERGHVYHICYAVSSDGLHWEKPDLGLVEFNGSRHNNLVEYHGGGEQNAGPHVIYRPDEPDPNRRFVRYHQNYLGHCALYSGDGIHWTLDETVLFQGSDAASPLYDQRTGRYFVASIKLRYIGRFLRRTLEVAGSSDGVHWSGFRPALWPDETDDLRARRNLSRARAVLSYDYPEHYDAQFNDVRAYPYAGLYLATVTMFECCGADIYKGTPGGPGSGYDDASTHLQLISSRSPDLTEWERVGPREPIIDRGPPGEWDGAFICASDGPVVVGDELWLYYGGLGVSQQHQTFQLATGWTVKQGDIPSGIGLATMRLDGFVSLDAGPSGGRLLTRPLMFTGEQLEINANVRGQVTVSVMDEDCQPIPGFDHKDCRPILGDSVRHSVSWKAGSDVSSLQSRTVRLEFILTRAELYAFRFVGLFPNGKAR